MSDENLNKNWDETKPSGQDYMSTVDDRIREMKSQIRIAFGKDHVFDDSGSVDDFGGHKRVAFKKQENEPTAIEDIIQLYFKDDDTISVLYPDGTVDTIASAADIGDKLGKKVDIDLSNFFAISNCILKNPGGISFAGSTLNIGAGLIALCPNGLNVDNQLNNVVYTASEALQQQNSYARNNYETFFAVRSNGQIYNAREYYIQDSAPSRTASSISAFYFNPKENKLFYAADNTAAWTQIVGAVLGRCVGNGTVITTLEDFMTIRIPMRRIWVRTDSQQANFTATGYYGTTIVDTKKALLKGIKDINVLLDELVKNAHYHENKGTSTANCSYCSYCSYCDCNCYCECNCSNCE
jgi:hypothetical protein